MVKSTWTKMLWTLDTFYVPTVHKLEKYNKTLCVWKEGTENSQPKQEPIPQKYMIFKLVGLINFMLDFLQDINFICFNKQ